MQAILDLLDKLQTRYQKLPEASRHSLLPWVLISVPVVLNSLAGSLLVMPLMVLLSSYMLYLSTEKTESYIFNLSKMQCRVGITIPLCIFISLWGISLAYLGKKEMMLGIVGPYSALLLLCAAPAYRWNSKRTARRVPLKISFMITGGFVFLGSLTYIKF
jgi:hypothetical protein